MIHSIQTFSYYFFQCPFVMIICVAGMWHCVTGRRRTELKHGDKTE